MLACTQAGYVPSEPPPLDTASLAELNLPCSEYDPTLLNVTVQNNSPTRVQLYWRDSDCDELFYSEITAGSAYTQGTYVASIWVLRDINDELLDWFEVDQTSDYTVEYP